MNSMWIIEFLKKLLEGRGFYPSLMVILSWSYLLVIIVVLICQFFLYVFGVKYNNYSFSKEVNKKKKESG